MSIWVGIKIWLRTILLNAGLWFAAMLVTGDMPGILMSVIFLFGGFCITLPLLVVIVPLVHIAARLPYTITGKMSWLWFYLALLIYLFFFFLIWLYNGRFFDYELVEYRLPGVTLIALTGALLLTRKSFIAISDQVSHPITSAGKEPG